MTAPVERLHGDTAFQDAQRKARFGHRDWIVWCDASGVYAEPMSVASVTEARSARSWSLIHGDNGNAMQGKDWLADNLIAWMRDKAGRP